MSLLMDALKRAEEAKRAAEEKPAAALHDQEPAARNNLPGDNSETPPPRPPGQPENTERTSGLPDLASHIDSVDAELASTTSTQTSRRQSPYQPTARRIEPARGNAERTAAKNVFAAKQPAQKKPATALIVGLGVVGALVIGAYFWWQLGQLAPQPVSAQGGGATGIPSSATASISQSASHPEPTSPREPASESPMQSHSDAAGSPGTAEPAAPARLPPSVTGAPATVPSVVGAQIEHTSLTPSPAKHVSHAAQGVPASENTVRFARQSAKPMQQLNEAYDALLAGRFDDAKRGYEQVLKADSRNVDALLGMATVASHRNASEIAHTYYSRAFEADPTNATAIAGLVEAASQGDPTSAESELKSALAMQPESASLLVALGNLFAREGRWSEAQEAFFRAYTVDSGNADIVVNLAISLDHLHQKQLARQYYRQALEAAAGPPLRSVSFDIDQIRQRLSDLAQ